MRNQIKYEWTLEEVDEHGDIIDSDFSNDEKLEFVKSVMEGKDLGLVRNEGNEIDGLVDRHHAYVRDGKLPKCFSDGSGQELPGYPIPQRFHEMLAKFLK